MRLIFGLVMMVALAGPVYAVAAETSYGYQSDSPITAGSLVSQVPDDSTKVVAATTANSKYLVGVATQADNSLVTLSNKQSNVQVARDGIVNATVSDVRGQIKQGDYIMASSYAGVGVKAVGGERVVGVALSDFNATTATKTKLIDAQGKTTELALGQIAVQVHVLTLSAGQAETSALVPPFLQSLADSIAAKRTSPPRIILAIIVLLIALVISGSMLVTAIRVSLTAIGRNPLASGKIQHNFLRITLVSIGLLAAGCAAVVFILKT